MLFLDVGQWKDSIKAQLLHFLPKIKRGGRMSGGCPDDGGKGCH